MSGGEWGLILTFVLACGSAALFLAARCKGRGHAFGQRSRWWALAVIGLTGAFSTGGALGVAALARSVPGVVIGLGIAAPSGLCLERIRGSLGERDNVLRTVATLGIDRLLIRLDDGMAEDKAQWCRGYIDPEWDANDLLLATISYRDHLSDRLADAERKDYRITATVQEIEARLRIVRIIDFPPDDLRDPRDEVLAALSSPGFRRRAQYEQYLDDLKLLAERLKHDARREMERLLTVAYCHGYQRLAPYTRRALAPPPAPSPAVTRAHPLWHRRGLGWRQVATDARLRRPAAG